MIHEMIHEKKNTARIFDEILLEAIDAALANFGESAKRIIYCWLETGRGIRREEIPSRLQEFQKALVEILGAGSMTLERLVVKDLYIMLGLDPGPQGNCTLAECVNHAKRHMKANSTQTRRYGICQVLQR